MLIVLLLVNYEHSIQYAPINLKIGKQFLDFSIKNDLQLKTLKGYAIETANLFKEAISIIPFTRLPVFSALGGSKNLIYSFYLQLSDWGELHDGINSFEDFLAEFGIIARPHDPEQVFLPQVEYLLSTLKIGIETPYSYDLSRARTIIQQDLRDNSRKVKGVNAIKNDAMMLMRLSDEDVSINPLDPIFCTWDLSLLRVRKRFFEEFPKATEWFMYTPSRLMDHYSMMNFQVREGTLTNEILSILDEDFRFQQKTQSLLDSMLTIINPKNEVGLQYTNKLAELRKQEVIQIEHIPEPMDDSIETVPVDAIFQKLFVNYIEQDRFESLKAIFTKKDFFDEILEIITSEAKKISGSGQVSEDLVNRLDSVIKKSENPK